MIETGLLDKVVLITGANHGIGAATARAFAAQGARVFITYLRLPPLGSTAEAEDEKRGDASAPGLALYNYRRAQSADEVVEQIRKDGGHVEAYEADLALPETVPVLFDKAESAFGCVDILVNNADYCVGDTFLPAERAVDEQVSSGYAPAILTAVSHDAHFAVNSRASALMMAEYTRRRIAQGKHGGRIINVSTDGASGSPHEVSYWASKFALESYSRAAAKELGQFGVTVNIVSPGPIQTGYISAELEEQIIPGIPLDRLGHPEDVADVIVFLASEQARWLTGQLIYVGGGHRMM